MVPPGGTMEREGLLWAHGTPRGGTNGVPWYRPGGHSVRGGSLCLQYEMKAPYFTSYEEEIVLFHEGTLIEGDIRAWLKKHEVEKALKNWKALKVSGQLVRRFPKQIPILAKEIWRSSIHSMDGVAW